MGLDGVWRAIARGLLIGGISLTGLSGLQQDSATERVPRPQEPKRPLPYIEEQVSFRNTNTADVTLAGTFTKPDKATAVPAVLLITGAGPQDRDETMAGHKPFLVLADYLTRKGIAVLRVDDRGTGASTGLFQAATTKDFASDAEAGVQYLLSRADVDKKHVGLIGHGEGAIVAAMVAARSPQQIAFVVLLNGTAVTGEKVLLAQTVRAQTAAGIPDEQINADYKIGSMLYEMVQRGSSGAEMRSNLDQAPENYWPFLDPWRQQIPKLQAPWLRFFLSYDPRVDLEKIQVPVLALFGEKDMHEDPGQNASAMKNAFSKGHNREAKVKTLPGLNYLFQKADTGLSREYASTSETVSPQVLESIQSWIAKQVE